ncbi:hypothetical protein M1293_02455 [Candidatus Parvarchaeota archaeon]|nr:hypothetical protein [Candidatus Parvarchaeota archaeon]
MDKGYFAVMAVLLLLVIAAILFYTNPGLTQRQNAIGLCELHCQNVTSGKASYSSLCISKNFSYGYSCAISDSANESVCGQEKTIYVSPSCGLVSVG